MKNSDPKFKSALGFLTVVEDPEHGLFGGYLLLNTAGRPLEFHCTAPIKPNRAQQILYGPTLEPYLFGEQIGKTLFEKAKTEPLALCTDREAALTIRSHIQVPVLLVLPAEEQGSTPGGHADGERSGKSWRIDPAHGHGPALVAFHLGRNRVAVSRETDDDRSLLTERLTDLAQSFDLAEPFARIREAIDEARHGG